MTRQLSVLFLMEDLCYGGTQRQTLELAARLDRRRFTPSILTLTGETDLDIVARENEIALTHLGQSRRVPASFFLRLPGILRKFGPDILVPCTALPNIWGRIWGRLLKIPVTVGTCRGGGGPKRQHEHLLWRMADHLVCNTMALRDVLCGLGVPPEKLSFIPNGVDTGRFTVSNRPSSRAPLILCVARLAGDKDLPTLIGAMRLVIEKMPDARLRLVGDGPEEKKLKELANRLLPGGQVEFVPGAGDVRGHYASARLFALSSRREGQPNVILEAMASGLPVCATAVGGIPAMIDEGRNGLLCPAGDARAMANNCLKLLANDSLADAMGRAGREYVEKNASFATMVGAHEELFARLWHEKTKGRK